MNKDEIIPHKKGQFCLFPTKNAEQETALEAKIPSPPKHHEYNESASLAAAVKQKQTMVEDIKNKTWPGSFLERNIDGLNSALRNFNHSLKMLERMGRLPADFDALGAQIDFLILTGQNMLRAEAKTVTTYLSLFGFKTQEEAKQAIEATDFSDTDWLAFGLEVYKQVHDPEASLLKKMGDIDWWGVKKKDETKAIPSDND